MRKALSVLLTAAMASSLLAACGSSSAPAAAPAETKAAETQATTAAATEAVKEVTEAAKEAEAKGDTITVGFAQVGHESDWRTASTNSVQAALSKENGIDLQFVDCDNDSAAQLEAVRNFIQQGVESDRLRAVGFGDEKPIASNGSKHGRKQNRRVELVPFEK